MEVRSAARCPTRRWIAYAAEIADTSLTTYQVAGHETALFTGAGASRAIGYPLTSEFLQRVLDEIDSKELFARTNGKKIDQQDRNALRRYLDGLLPGLQRNRKRELPLITDIFSLVEYAIASGESLPIGDEKKLRHCRSLLKQAITDVLVGDFLLDWDQTKPKDRREKRTLDQFAQWARRQNGSLGIVTTNYDTGLEYELYEGMKREEIYNKTDLGFDWREVGSGEVRTRPANPMLRIYKLHGSLDLLRCSLCGHVYFNPRGAIALQPFIRKVTADNSCTCRHSVRLSLHIVAPSFVRDMREANLLSIWRSALEWMRTAERWIIVGYSLPPEDLAVRSLLMRAYATAPTRPRVTVVQRSNRERARYKLLFPDCHYLTGGLESFLA